MIKNCHFCHLPVKSKDSPRPFCNYGCRLCFYLYNEKKSLEFIRIILGFLICLTIFFLPVGSSWLMPFSHETMRFVLSSIVVLLLGLPYLKYSFLSLRQGIFGSHIILSLAFIMDYGFSFYVLFYQENLNFNGYPPFYYLSFILLIGYLISYVKALVLQKIGFYSGKISRLRPQKAHRISKGQGSDVETSTLIVGDVIQVQPGEVIPCDGKIISGTTSVDESLFTAEDMISLKQKNDSVIGSTLNRDGTIQVQIQEDQNKHFLSHVIEILEKSIFQTFSLKMRRSWFVLMCFMLLGFGVGARIYFLKVLSLNEFFQILITITIAMSFSHLYERLSLPAVIGVSKSALNGILIRDGRLFQTIAKLHTVFFHKTGTLTKGKFYFSQLYSERGVNQGELLSMLFSLESYSKHPLSQGVQTHPWYLEISRHEVRDFQSHAGLGICGYVQIPGQQERFVAIGNQRFLKRFQMQISRATREKLEDLESMGETVILCGWERQVRGLTSLADTLRSDARDLFTRLNKLKVASVMITGDQDNMITNLTYADGLHQVYTRCLPEEKMKKVTNRQEKGALVGVVGNAYDDIEVYKKADVSFMLDFSKSILQDDKSSVILLGHRLLKLSNLIRYSKRITRVLTGTNWLIGLYLLFVLLIPFMQPISPLFVLMIMSLLSILLTLFPLRLMKGSFK